MTRLPINSAYLALLRTSRHANPSLREFDRDQRQVRRMELAARLDAARYRGF